MYQMDEPCGSGFCGRRRVGAADPARAGRHRQPWLHSHPLPPTPMPPRPRKPWLPWRPQYPVRSWMTVPCRKTVKGSLMVAHNTEEYRYNPENPFMAVSGAPLSTFGADVDTASYANIRRMLLGGSPVPEDAVRIEEMLNYFYYDYPEPKRQGTVFRNHQAGGNVRGISPTACFRLDFRLRSWMRMRCLPPIWYSCWTYPDPWMPRINWIWSNVHFSR